MTYDVIIIGAGPGGIFSAYELMQRRPEWKVAVLEAGKDRLHPCPMYGHAAHGRFPAGVPGRVRGHSLPGRGRH